MAGLNASFNLPADHKENDNRAGKPPPRQEKELDILYAISEQVAVQRKAFTVGARPLRLTEKVLNLIAKVRIQVANIQDVPPHKLLVNSSTKQLLQDCESVSWVVVTRPDKNPTGGGNNNDDDTTVTGSPGPAAVGGAHGGSGGYVHQRGRSLHFEAFPGMTVLELHNCVIDRIVFVQGVASLVLRNTVLRDHLSNFMTLRHITFDYGAIDVVQLAALCYSLRSVTVLISDKKMPASPFYHDAGSGGGASGGAAAAVGPSGAADDKNSLKRVSFSWTPSRQLLKRFEVVSHEMGYWDSLTTVRFQGTHRVSKMARVASLLTLDVSWQHLANLTRLSLASLRIHAFSELAPLAHCTGLTSLDLSDNMLHCLDGCDKLPTSIQRLDLSQNRLFAVIQGIDHFVNVAELNLSNNDLTLWHYVKVLNALPKLTHLSLATNPLLEPFGECPDDAISFLCRFIVPDNEYLQQFNGATVTKKHRQKGDEKFNNKYGHLHVMPNTTQLKEIKNKERSVRRSTGLPPMVGGIPSKDFPQQHNHHNDAASAVPTATDNGAASTAASGRKPRRKRAGPPIRDDESATHRSEASTATNNNANKSGGGGPKPASGRHGGPKRTARAVGEKGIIAGPDTSYLTGPSPSAAAATGADKEAATVDVTELKEKYGEGYLAHLPVTKPPQSASAGQKEQEANNKKMLSIKETGGGGAGGAAAKASAGDTAAVGSSSAAAATTTPARQPLGGASAQRTPTADLTLRRRQDGAADVPAVFEQFLSTLHDAEWVYFDDQKRRIKGFNAGLKFTMSLFTNENDAVWEIDNDRCDVHKTAREVLLHDMREQVPDTTARLQGKTLIRLMEVRTGGSRMIQIQTKDIRASSSGKDTAVQPQLREKNQNDFAVRRPYFSIVLETSETTQPKDIDVSFYAPLGGYASSAARPQGQGAMTRETFQTTQKVDLADIDPEIDRQARRVCRISKPTVLAAFAVPSGPLATLFQVRLRAQLLDCHDKLSASGILREWPLHLDGIVVAKSKERNVPITGSLQHVGERIISHQPEPTLRQRMGFNAVVEDDELALMLQSYIFLIKPRPSYICVAYVNEVPEGTPWAVAGEKSKVIAITQHHLLAAEDRNFAEAHSAGMIDPEEAFVRPENRSLANISEIAVTFDYQCIILTFSGMTSERLFYVTRDSGVTLSILSALSQVGLISVDQHLQQQRISAASRPGKFGEASKAAARAAAQAATTRPKFMVLSCPFMSLTKSPLVFVVDVFYKSKKPHPAYTSAQKRAATYPLRHFADPRQAAFMSPGSVVVTSQEICLLEQHDPRKSQIAGKITSASLSSIHSIELPHPDLFSLMFAVVVSGVGKLDRWVLCAAHPNTIAYLVRELQSTRELKIGELSKEDVATADGK